MIRKAEANVTAMRRDYDRFVDCPQRQSQRRTLSYLTVAADSEPAPAIVPAALSVAFGVAGV
ncbi:MAG TPA: hypothetical protein VNL70_10065, partial [Tepidisphaeraceae bacterium]|nr:hypothetical protein [Tepidisphaeraceae bacterium]